MTDDRDDFEGEDDSVRKQLLRKLAKRIQNPRQLGGDAADLMGAVLETSDRAKTEAIRMVAREVRNYLDALELKEGLQSLLTGHSLEVRMSLSLKPLPKAEPEAAAEPAPEPPAGPVED